MSKREIVQRITCPECKRFVGFITSDGNGPQLTECLAATAENSDVLTCPTLKAMACYLPVARPTHISGHGGPPDDDAFGYRNVAVRAMEDQ